MDIHFSSDRMDWATPPEVFLPLNKEFGFTLDPCCFPETAKCDKFYTPVDDGLSKDWSQEVVFMNPPYGRQIKNWIKKAYHESFNGATVVCLIPARTDTSWWHDYCLKAAEIRFVRGRIKFLKDGVQKDSAPFPVAIVIFKTGGRD